MSVAQFDWFGGIPEGWSPIRLKNALAIPITDGPHLTPDFISAGVPFLSVDGIQDGELVFENTRFVSQEDHEVFCRKARPIRDDILMGKAASTGKIARVKVDREFSIWSPLALIRLNPENYEPRFVEYCLKSKFVQAQIDILCTSNTQKNISMDDIPSITFLTLARHRQTLISDFLDRETGKIDELIAKKRELIERLKEKRTALISHVVTKGLPPEEAAIHGLPVNPPLKPSGIPWLGDIPEHWKVVKATRGFRVIGSGTTPKADNPDFYGGDIPWVTTSELRETLITETKQAVTEQALEEHSALKLYPVGTTLIAMYGATIGRLGTLGIQATVNQACCAYAHGLKLTPRFMYYWLWMRRPILISLSVGGGQPNLSQDDLKQLWVPAPEIEEQDRMTEFLDRQVGQLQKVMDAQESAIEKLQEYRSALITAAVTGKIDVRGEVPE